MKFSGITMQRGYEKQLYRLVRHHSGSKKSNCLVFIPWAGEDMLYEHLRLLQRQVPLDFDVMVICKKVPKVKTSLNMIYYLEQYPLGSSGGFGIGQVLGYTLGYEYVVNADIGAMPQSPHLVERLKARAKREQKAVVALSMGIAQTIGSPNQYGICTRKIFEEEGFEYFRFFKGGEDADFLGRLWRLDHKMVLEKSVGIRHAPLPADYIEVLRSMGNKYIYYKKSNVLSHVMLARAALGRGRVVYAMDCMRHAWLEVVKTRMFYISYPDIVQPVMQAMWLDMNGVSPRRTVPVKVLERRAGMKAVRIGCLADGQGGVLFPGGKIGAALGLLRAIFSAGDYFAPTRRFLESGDRSLLAVLFMFKPILHTDGKIYSKHAHASVLAANAVASVVISPLLLAVLLTSVARVSKEEYPQRVDNLERNLRIYVEYLQKMVRERK